MVELEGCGEPFLVFIKLTRTAYDNVFPSINGTVLPATHIQGNLVLCEAIVMDQIFLSFYFYSIIILWSYEAGYAAIFLAIIIHANLMDLVAVAQIAVKLQN